MKAFQKKFVALSAVASLAVLGAACDDDDATVVDPGVEEPADDTIVEGDTEVEGDTTVEGDTETELELDPGTETEGE